MLWQVFSLSLVSFTGYFLWNKKLYSFCHSYDTIWDVFRSEIKNGVNMDRTSINGVLV